MRGVCGPHGPHARPQPGTGLVSAHCGLNDSRGLSSQDVGAEKLIFSCTELKRNGSSHGQSSSHGQIVGMIKVPGVQQWGPRLFVC